MIILNWVTRMLGWALRPDPEIIKEKKTSKRAERKHLYGWLKHGLGKEAFAGTKMVYHAGWGGIDDANNYEEWIRSGQFYKLRVQEKELKAMLEKDTAASQYDRGISVFYSIDVYLWVQQDGTQLVRFVDGPVTGYRIFREFSIPPIDPHAIGWRKLIYPV